MLEYFFAFLNSFKKGKYSNQQSATTKKSGVYSLILLRGRFYGIMLLSCLRMKFTIWIKLVTEITMRTVNVKVHPS